MPYDVPRGEEVASMPFNIHGYADYREADAIVMGVLSRGVREQGDAIGAAECDYYEHPDWVVGGLLSSTAFGWGLWGCGDSEGGLLGEYRITKSNLWEGTVELRVFERPTPEAPSRHYYWADHNRERRPKA